MDISSLANDASPVVGPHGIEVGDIFVESWGYDQTNANAYQVVRVSAASVWIREIAFTTVGEGHSTRLVPDRDNFLPQPSYEWSRTKARHPDGQRKVPQSRDWITMSTYSGARLWDGEHSYFDTIAAGYPGH